MAFIDTESGKYDFIFSILNQVPHPILQCIRRLTVVIHSGKINRRNKPVQTGDTRKATINRMVLGFLPEYTPKDSGNPLCLLGIKQDSEFFISLQCVGCQVCSEKNTRRTFGEWIGKNNLCMEMVCRTDIHIW